MTTERRSKTDSRVEELEAKVEALQQENEALKLALEAALAPPEPAKTTTLYEADGTPNVQNWVIDETGNTHHFSP